MKPTQNKKIGSNEGLKEYITIYVKYIFQIYMSTIFVTYKIGPNFTDK